MVARHVAPSRSGSAAFVLAALVGWAAMTVQTYSTSWVGRRVLSDLRIDLFAHVQRLELGYFERERAGRIISRLTNDIDALEDLVTDGVTSTLRNSLILVGTAVALVLARLAPRTRHARRVPADGGRHDRRSACALRAPTASCASAWPTSPRHSRRTSRAFASSRSSTAASATPSCSIATSERYREANVRTVWLNA